MSSINKIVLKGTGRMSLHERFTKLKFDGSGGRGGSGMAHHNPRPLSPPRPIKIEDDDYRPPAPPNRSNFRSGQGYSPPPGRVSRPRARTPDQPRYSARRMRSMSPMTRMRRAISPDNRRSRRDDPKPNIFSTNRVQKKSVYLRLGVRPRNSNLADRMSSGIPVWSQSRQSNWRGGGGGFRMSRAQSTQSLNRWSSQGSLNSYEIPRYQMNNNRRFGRGRGGGGGGGRRNFAYNRAGRFRYGQGWFGGRRRGGRGGGGRGGRGGWSSRFRQRRGGGQYQPPPKREDLDAELDAYMAGSRGVLDREIDSYMSSATTN
eukprot:TRINITY_DN13077_c0_g1_i1.p1 TRINITY_DN13077_c0_g1~~TRINITY_DN13077_c0_g1_i1.p1  ORF type:complete len:316 (+),score=90.49 TRINITY_DN13077_c0_g1_i1:111-1058(+)